MEFLSWAEQLEEFKTPFCSWFVFAVCVCVCLQFIWTNSECVQINCKCAQTANSHS